MNADRSFRSSATLSYNIIELLLQPQIVFGWHQAHQSIFDAPEISRLDFVSMIYLGCKHKSECQNRQKGFFVFVEIQSGPLEAVSSAYDDMFKYMLH